MTDIPMKNKNRTSDTVCREYGFFIVNLFCLYATELTNIS